MTASENDTAEVIFREVTERFWVLRLITEVRKTGVFIRFSPVQRTFRGISVEQIQEVQVTTYSATSFAGWHWGMHRAPGGNTVYRLHGGRGVEIVLTNGERWFIGSQHPAELEEAIDQIHSSEASTALNT